jgi:hypothetical protein
VAELPAEIAARLRCAPPRPHYAYTNPQVLVPFWLSRQLREAGNLGGWPHRVELSAYGDPDRTFMDPDGTIIHQPWEGEDRG